MEIFVKDFDLKNTVTCGQIFRFEELDDESFDIILPDRVINIRQDGNKIAIKSNKEDNLEEVIKTYFDLNYDYESIYDKVLKIDKNNKEIVDFSKGLKMINEPIIETCISFILSSNNRVPQIKKSLDYISNKYGEKVLFNNKEYYLFPDISALSKASLNDLRDCKVGFRDKYLYNFINKVNNNEFDFNIIKDMNSDDALKYLMSLNGVGEKVASCILLFGYHRFDVFPIDTWVKKYMKDEYNIEGINNIKKYVYDKYKELSGIVIQYMFNYKRNK